MLLSLGLGVSWVRGRVVAGALFWSLVVSLVRGYRDLKVGPGRPVWLWRIGAAEWERHSCSLTPQERLTGVVRTSVEARIVFEVRGRWSDLEVEGNSSAGNRSSVVVHNAVVRVLLEELLLVLSLLIDILPDGEAARLTREVLSLARCHVCRWNSSYDTLLAARVRARR